MGGGGGASGAGGGGGARERDSLRELKGAAEQGPRLTAFTTAHMGVRAGGGGGGWEC
jgi:hypothetical protein